MRRKKGARPRWFAFAVLLILTTAAAAGLWYYFQPVPAVQLTLARTEFGALPGWNSSDAPAALAALRRSCLVVLRLPPDHPMGGAGYAGAARDWRNVCSDSARAEMDPRSARSWFENWFTPFRLSTGSQRQALFTGYYEPEIHASRTRHGPYTTPVYGLPRNLVTADLGLFRPEFSGIHLVGQVTDQRFEPFPTRAQIDAGGLNDAAVLLYASDPISVFFLHIQGSGRALLEDGAVIRLAYAAQNGRAFTPVGRTLIQRGDLDRAHMSMQAIRAWLETHPDAARQTMESDASYVFFRELPLGDPNLGSPGSEGVPLTPQASIAVDPSFQHLGVPVFVVAEAPAADPARPPARFAQLCIAQDTGGAIKGVLRADIFWGFGTRAEAIAGRMKSGGSLFVLLPKAVARQIPSHFLESS